MGDLSKDVGHHSAFVITGNAGGKSERMYWVIHKNNRPSQLPHYDGRGRKRGNVTGDTSKNVPNCTITTTGDAKEETTVEILK